MYQFSRAIYRELAPQILAPAPGSPASSNHEAVLRACEAVVTRMAIDRHYFARPERTLFCDIRGFFPMAAQARVHMVIDRYIGLAQQYLERASARGLHGRQRRSPALPRDHPQGLGLPAHAAGAQRLLPLPPAPRRNRGPRAGGGLAPRHRPHPPTPASPAPRAGVVPLGCAHALGRRRRRHVHRRRPDRRRRRAPHRQGPLHALARAVRRGAATRCALVLVAGRRRAGSRRALRARHDRRDERPARGPHRAHRADRDRRVHRRDRARAPEPRRTCTGCARPRPPRSSRRSCASARPSGSAPRARCARSSRR